MRQQTAVANPFLMITNPAAILDAVERSVRLQALERRVCRPLDRPLIPKLSANSDALQDGDWGDEEDIGDMLLG